MINLEVWCPVERVVGLLLYKGIKAGAKSVYYELDGVTQGVVDCAKGIDQALGFNVARRRGFLSLPEVRGKVIFNFDDGSEELRLTVKHCLWTAAPALVAADEKRNGFICRGDGANGTIDVCYPEAVTTTAGHDFQISSCVVTDGVRPYWDYIYTFTSAADLVICGPASVSSRNGALIKKGSLYYPLIGVDVPVTIVDDDEEVVTPTVSISQLSSRSVPVVLKFGNQVSPFVIGQRADDVFGRPIGYDTYWRCIALVVDAEHRLYRESDSKVKALVHDGVLELPLVERNGIVTLQSDWAEYVDDVILNSDDYDFLKRYAYSKDCITLRAADGTVCTISSSGGNVACFAFTLAMFVSQQTVGTVTAFLSALSYLLDNNILKIVKGQLWGNTAKMLAEPVDVKLQLGRNGLVSTKLHRKQVTFDEATDGSLLVLGYNFAKDTQAGEPDHYVLVRKDGNRLPLVYDPFTGTRESFGRDMLEVYKSSSDRDETSVLIDFGGGE